MLMVEPFWCQWLIWFLSDPTSLQNIQNAERPKLKLAEFMSEYFIKYLDEASNKAYMLYT